MVKVWTPPEMESILNISGEAKGVFTVRARKFTMSSPPLMILARGPKGLSVPVPETHENITIPLVGSEDATQVGSTLGQPLALRFSVTMNACFGGGGVSLLGRPSESMPPFSDRSFPAKAVFRPSTRPCPAK